ncbi:MAG TPA: tyrosine-type recombinase/integrase [Usitatibacter sp.]|nr:tyrosine-type recombinase/integrase [Usitatibacter sp.]
MLALVLQYQPHGAFLNFRGIPVLSAHNSILSRNGVSGNPGAAHRDLALFNLAIDSKLRGCDLVALRVKDLGDSGHILSRAIVMQQKTKRPVQFEMTEGTRQALLDWIRNRTLRSEDYIFPSRARPGGHLSTRQYGRIVHRWVDQIGLDGHAYGTHTMRRTKASLIYRRTKNLRAVQLLTGTQQAREYREIPGHRGRRCP